MSGATEDSASNPPELSADVRLLTNEELPRTSEDWEEKVEPILPVDFLILAVKDWEFNTFLSQLDDGFFKSFHKKLGLVYFGNIRGDEKKQKVAVMKCGMGPDVQGPEIVAPKAVKKLKPKAVFNVGACAGLKKVKQGDVVLSAKVRTYAYTKDTEDGFEERGVGVPLNRDLGRVALHAASGWKAPFKGPTKLDVKVHSDGVVLSGPRVVNSLEEKKKLMKRFGDAIALEMEAEGLYKAAHDLNMEWMVIKGVSDFADGEKAKGDVWRPFSSGMAASLTAHILRDANVFKDWKHYGDGEGSPLKRKRSPSPPVVSIGSSPQGAKKRSTAVKEGNPSTKELRQIAENIGNSWKPLGRELTFIEDKLIGFDKNHEEYSEKPYQMLLAWLRDGGKEATYEVLNEALCEVGRRDLAEKFCQKQQ